MSCPLTRDKLYDEQRVLIVISLICRLATDICCGARRIRPIIRMIPHNCFQFPFIPRTLGLLNRVTRIITTATRQSTSNNVGL